MPTHDYDIANQSGAAFRGDLNDALEAIVGNNSSASAPSPTFAYMWWADTTNGLLKQRNSTNASWMVRGTLAETFVVARSSNTILGVADYGRTFNATSSFTQTLTAAATLGDGWFCHYRNNGSGVITFDPNSSETIDGATTLKLLPGESCTIWCTGSAFITVGRTLQKNAAQLLQNIGFAVSVSANAITVALKDEAGNDPSPGSPVRIGFRSATLTTGTPDVLEVAAAASVVASSGSTLGTVSAQAHRIYIIGINDAGTFRLGLWNPWNNSTVSLKGIDEAQLYSSTAEGGAGAADSAQVLYSGSAVSSKAVRVLGYFESTQTTAGTWAAEDAVVQVMGPGVKRTGDVVQSVHTRTGASATGSTTLPDDDSIPQITEGNEYMTAAITPQSAANLIEVDVCGFWASSNANSSIAAALFRDAVSNALAVGIGGRNNAANTVAAVPVKYIEKAPETSAITYRVRAGTTSAGTTTFNGWAGVRKYGGVIASFLSVSEVFV